MPNDNQIMPYQRVGVGHMPSYQVSAVPFMTSSLTVPTTGSTLEVVFPQVTSFVVVRNDGANVIRFGFSDEGVRAVTANNYATIPSSGSFAADFKVVRLYLMGDSGGVTGSATVVAGLTGIDYEELQANWTGTIGVG